MSGHVPERNEWLTLAQAAERLHVHPTTLRRWANGGQIPVMVTPGGHRRFSSSDVESFKRERRSLRPAGGLEQAWADKALAETRERVDGGQPDRWIAKFDSASRERHRVLGHRLMGLILKFISDGEDSDEAVGEAKRIGQEYAANAIELELPLKQALEASMFFRDALVGSTMQLPENMRVRPEEKMRLLERINILLNTVQLAVAEAYDEDNANSVSGS